jgi:hypothetical protein
MVNMLCLAAWYGAASDVDSFLRKYGLFCLDMCSRPQGLNALHIAVVANKPDMVELLLTKAKARPDVAADDDGWTPLLLACKYQVGLPAPCVRRR